MSITVDQPLLSSLLFPHASLPSTPPLLIHNPCLSPHSLDRSKASIVIASGVPPPIHRHHRRQGLPPPSAVFSFCLIVVCILCCHVVSPTPPPLSSLPESPVPHLSISHICRPLPSQSCLCLPPFLKVDCCISMTGLDDPQHCHCLSDQCHCCHPLHTLPTIRAEEDEEVQWWKRSLWRL